jgi:hypothetical protein
MRELLFFLAGTVTGCFGALFAIRLRTKEEPVARPPITPVSSTARLEPTPRATLRHPIPTDPDDSLIEISYGDKKIKGRVKQILIVLTVIALLAALLVIFWLFVRSKLEPAPAAQPPVVINIHNIHNSMQNGQDTPTYHVEPVPNREVVSGLVGSYYYIDLKDAASQKSLFFGPEQYIQDEYSNDFRDAMAAFHADILRHVQQENIPYRLFVRGSADHKGNDAPYLGELIEGESKTITYLPLVPGSLNQYSQQPAEQVVPKRYRNEHLPNLRAAYMQDKLRALKYEAHILQGNVTRNAEEAKDRFAVMLLYVNWPDRVAGTPVR